MLHVDKECLPHLASYEKTTFDGKEYFEKCDIMSVNLEKVLKYLKVP